MISPLWRLSLVHGRMSHSTNKHMLDSSHSALQFTLPTTAALLPRVDNGNNVDWSNSIDLQILTNIHGSSVPSLALNNTLTSPRPHIIIALSQATKQVGLINLGLRFWQSSWLRYVHYRPVYSLYYLSLGNLSSPEAWPQVQSKQLNEHETSNFLASPRHPPTPGQPQFCPLTFCPAHPALAPSQSYFFCLAVEINSRFGRTFLTNFVLYGESILMVISSISLPLSIHRILLHRSWLTFCVTTGISIFIISLVCFNKMYMCHLIRAGNKMQFGQIFAVMQSKKGQMGTKIVHNQINLHFVLFNIAIFGYLIAEASLL